jgi:hypothetical protein
MKHTAILILMLCSISAFTQTITKSFILAPNGVYYMEVTRETNDATGTYYESGVIVGPLAQISSDQADKIEGRMNRIANSAYVVSYTNREINEQKSIAASIATLTGVSPLKVIQDRYQAFLTANGWTIDPGTGYVPIVFTVNAQGVLRYSVNGAATKAAEIFGNIIRLNQYPAAGTDTDFYRSEDGGVYFSLPNRAVKIKRP